MNCPHLKPNKTHTFGRFIVHQYSTALHVYDTLTRKCKHFFDNSQIDTVVKSPNYLNIDVISDDHGWPIPTCMQLFDSWTVLPLLQTLPRDICYTIFEYMDSWKKCTFDVRKVPTQKELDQQRRTKRSVKRLRVR